MRHTVYLGILCVTSDIAILHEMGFDRFDRADYAGIVWWEKTNQRHHQGTSVKVMVSVILHEGIQTRVETFAANLLMNSITKFLPSRGIDSEPAHFRHFNQAIDGDPGHHLRVDEMAPRTAHLPNAIIRLLPSRLKE